MVDNYIIPGVDIFYGDLCFRRLLLLLTQLQRSIKIVHKLVRHKTIRRSTAARLLG